MIGDMIALREAGVKAGARMLNVFEIPLLFRHMGRMVYVNHLHEGTYITWQLDLMHLIEEEVGAPMCRVLTSYSTGRLRVV